MKIARGSTQEQWWYAMQHGGCASAIRHLRGKARQYAGHYQKSFANLIDRAKCNGWSIERTPGPRGGEWGATYRATMKETAKMMQGTQVEVIHGKEEAEK